MFQVWNAIVLLVCNIPACSFWLRANEEIAEVRSRAVAEVMALQATLRKEEIKIQSLEKSVEEKVSINPAYFLVQG